MQNYPRLTSVYLAEIFALKDIDSSIWNYFEEGQFCMNKSSVPHSDIGVDHPTEHENRSMNVFGGIKGITTNK